LPAETWHDYMVKAETKETPRGLPGIEYKPSPPPQVQAAAQPVQVPVVKKKKPMPKVEEAAAPTEEVRPKGLLDDLFGVKKN